MMTSSTSEYLFLTEAATGGVLKEKFVLRNFTKFSGKPLCQRLFFNIVAGLRPSNLFEKEPLAQLFTCEIREISKNTFFTEHLWSTASILSSARFFSPNGIKFPRQRIFKPDGRSINMNCSSACWFMACQSLHLSKK